MALAGTGCSSKAVDPSGNPQPHPQPQLQPQTQSVSHARSGAGASNASGATPSCTAQTLASVLHFPEASGATYVADAQDPYILIVGDSGNRGEMARIRLDPPDIAERGKLPLGHGASDDLEGVSMLHGTLYGITSSGWMRHWQQNARGRWELSTPAYPLATPGQSRMVCADGHDTNCARNYEGLCLRPDTDTDADTDTTRPGQECVGFAAAKADGALYCLTMNPDGRLAVDASRSIQVSRPETLTGCHFEPDGHGLWAGTNLFGGNRVYRITGWNDPATAQVHEVGMLGSGFIEATALAPGGAVYRFSDLGGATSLVDRYICE